jgi:hypothetical protein
LSDHWHWLARYSDDSEWHEYAPDGTSRGWRSIDQRRLVAFELIPQYPELPGFSLLIHELPAGARPIFFRRRRITQGDAALGTTPRLVTIHVIGWQRTVDGRNEKLLTAIYEDGNYGITDDERVIE